MTAMQHAIIDQVLRLPPEDVEKVLRFVETLHPEAGPAMAPVSDEEFERLLDEVSAGPTLPPLPRDFSRADIYGDHA
jgi:hypothetical protein